MPRKKHLPNRGLPAPVVFGGMAGIRIGVAALAAPTWPAIRAATRAAGCYYATRMVNRKRLERAREHLRIAYPQAGEAEVERLAVASYQHLFLLGAEIARGPRSMNVDSVLGHMHQDSAESSLVRSSTSDMTHRHFLFAV